MKFLKTHLVPLICTLAVVAALVWWYFWLGGKQENLHREMEDRLKVSTNLVAAGKQAISIPGLPPLNGPITPEVIAVKTKVQNDMHDSAEQIAAIASKQNEAGRVVRKDGKVIPLLDGTPEPGYLPVVSAERDTYDFAEAYNHTFDRWISTLVTGSATPPEGFDAAHSGAAPTKTEADAAWDLHQRKIVAASGGITQLQSVGNQAQYLRDFVNERASKLRMYVTRGSFQHRLETKNEPQIFEALVDCWLQADVVHAIDAVNTEALDKVAVEPDRNVGHAPIKRLTRIAVGASGVTAGLFLPNDKRATLDYTRSMTGRTGTDKYDVTGMNIVIDIDPSYINQFIAALYKQNNSYTVLNMKVTAVDPFVTASDAYVYGKQQVVSLDLQVEAVLFRGWTGDIMPAAYKTGAVGAGGAVGPGGEAVPAAPAPE